MKRKNFLRLMALLLSLVFFSGCVAQKVPQEDEASSQEQEAKPEEEQTPQEPEPEPVEEASATLVAVGDNLLHNTISWDAQQSDGSYDFTPVYQPVKDLIQSADIAFLNQEVPLNGTVGRYPSLDAPQQAADAIVDCGFDIVNEASNHSLDKGIDGLMNTLSAWKARNMPVIGAFSTPEEAAQPCILERNGITFGFLGYTYGTNGIPIPEGKEYAISLIDKDKIAQDMAALRPQCDYLVISLHWGTEYLLEPTQEQQELAQFVADQGADLILGHHPHVLESAQWLTRADGGQTFCIYSLGNFVSSQNTKETMLGGMLSLTVHRRTDGTIETLAPGVLPIITHFENGGKNYRVYPLQDYTQDLISLHAVKKYDSPITLDYYNGLAQQVLGEFLQTKESFACHP